MYDDKPVEAWSYGSERGMLMVGIESRALGDEVVAPSASRAAVEAGQQVGFSFESACPAGTQHYSLSFLHYDHYQTDTSTEEDDLDDGADWEDLRLQIYVKGTKVVADDPHFTPITGSDPNGGFRFYDEGRIALVDLITTGNLASAGLCNGSPFTVKIVAECYATDSTCDDCNPTSEDSSCLTSGDGTGNGQNKGYVADVWVRKVVPVTPPTFPPTYQTVENRINLSSGVTAIKPSGYGMFLSESNTNFRHLFRGGAGTGLLDSVIVRYGHGELDECNSTYTADWYNRCIAAQARLMKAVGHAVGPYDYNRSFNYFETNSWKNDWDKTWLVDTLLNTEAYTDGLLGGRYPLAHWALLESADPPEDAGYGEHADRWGIREYYDENATLSDATDDFTLFFFHPSQREDDATPGWYQRYTFDGEFDFSDPSAPSELAFEVGHWGCVGCDEGTDMVIEFSWTRTDPDPDETGSEVYVMTDTDPTFQISSWVADEGTYTFAVTMYSVDRPFAARHGFFRLFDADDESPTSGYTYGTEEDWVYETGIWVDGTFDVPLYYDLDDFNSANDPNAAEQALNINDCLWLFWTDAVGWDTDCGTLFAP